MMNLLASARFHTTVAQLRQLPRDGVPEVAFVGRSNAGKSSAINALCQRRRLAFASRTPGRTQALNYFAVGPVDREVGYLVDTPGYGYASAPQDVKKTWDQLGGRYLQSCKALRGVVLIVDIRREITDRDRALIDWIAPQVPLLAVASKCDKLNRAERVRACRAIAAQIGQSRDAGGFTVIGFSATDQIGVDAVREHIQQWLATGPQAAAGPADAPAATAAPAPTPLTVDELAPPRRADGAPTGQEPR
ncbi:MAG: ribosome biogenesis GTP-binding protein YihA/YsxC [Burkholderiaceae bacterium]